MWHLIGEITTSGIEPLVGVGGFGIVAFLATHIIRRTAQIDTRNDATSKAYLEVAFRRESEMSARLDAALATIEKLHAEQSLARSDLTNERREHNWEPPADA